MIGLDAPLPADDANTAIFEGETAQPVPTLDDEGRILHITHPDGAIDVFLNPRKPTDTIDSGDEHHDNLADLLSDTDLGVIANDLLERIDADKADRTEWIEQNADLLKILGLKPEAAATGEGSVSNVRHPLLLEAVLRFQANAGAELLPADGPCKVRNDDPTPEMGEDAQAQQLEADINQYLTRRAPEYYPDMERMLWSVGLTGLGIKKVYKCPLRRRPVSETVSPKDIIVSPNSVSVETAARVTHVIPTSPADVKRMQFAGAYRKIELSGGSGLGNLATTAIDDAQDEISGQDRSGANRVESEREYVLYECYCELDLPGYEHEDEDGEPTGIPLPYKVTLDVESMAVLEIRRNWAKDDESLVPQAKLPFVGYVFVPWEGFYPIGLGKILSNTNNALTAAWRLLLDSGMFANFPGFLYAKGAAHGQNRMSIRVKPGEGAAIDTGGGDIRNAAMPLPYNAQSMAPLMQLAESVSQYGQRVGGTAEVAVGEGRQDAPVGTTVAIIEQAIKIMSAVHKRLHAAQARELALLQELIADDAENFIKLLKKPKMGTDAATLRAALMNYDLAPQADPNTASHMQRIMRMVAVKQLQQQSPQLYDARKVDELSLRMIGVEAPEQLFAKMPPPMPGPDPLKIATANARMMDSQTKARAQAFKEQQAQAELESNDKDRETRLQQARMAIAEKLIVHPEVAPVIDQLMQQPGGMPTG